MPEPAVYRTESAARAHRRLQLRDAIREEVWPVLSADHCSCVSCTTRWHDINDALADRILARYDRIEADQ